MFTTKFDYKTGTNYNTSSYALKFVAFNGSQFKLMTDLVTNGFMTPIQAFTETIRTHTATNNKYVATASLSGTTVTFGSVFTYALPDTDSCYYIMAYYVDGSGNICVLSANLIEIEVVSEGGTKSILKSVSTLSNNFSFALPSISQQMMSATERDVIIDTQKFNNLYKDYETGSFVSNDFLMFVYLSDEEVQMISKYYNDSRNGGLILTYGTQEKKYENLTIEEAFMFAIYYYRHRNDNYVNTDSNTLHDNLTSNSGKSIEVIVTTYLADSMKLTNLSPDNVYKYLKRYSINSLTDTTEISGGYYSHNLFAIHINTSGRYVEKVSSNYLNIKYKKTAGDAIDGELKFTVDTINNLING